MALMCNQFNITISSLSIWLAEIHALLPVNISPIRHVLSAENETDREAPLTISTLCSRCRCQEYPAVCTG